MKNLSNGITKMKTGNFKYYIILILCVVVITLSIRSLIKRPMEPLDPPLRHAFLDPELYYNKEMPALELAVKDRKVTFPTTKNILILGVNKEVDEALQHFEQLFETLDISSYDVEIIILTNQEVHQEIRYVKTYYYNNAEFERFFKLGEGAEFVLLVNKENKIKHYLNKRTSLHNIRLLIERFR